MGKRTNFEGGVGEDDYVAKCMKCTHSYTRQNESDVLFCSLRECKFKERKNKSK